MKKINTPAWMALALSAFIASAACAADAVDAGKWKVSRAVTPPKLEKPLPKFPSNAVPKNVILIIGDGMGRGSYDLASLWAHGDTRRLFMQSLPVAGLCTTHSKNSSVTDSAASATAFACGEKTNNGMIGMAPDGAHLESIATLARGLGKSVAIVTSDSLQGATPSSFFAHQAHRGMAAEIIADMAECGFEILVGNSGSRDFVDKHREKLEADGIHFVKSSKEMAAEPAGARIIGQVSSSTIFTVDDEELANLAMESVKRLAKNANGFFMMVESTYPDKGGHDNNPDASVMGVIQADWVAKKAVDYASTSGDTLVIVTADHETGGLSALMSMEEGSRPVIFYATTNHTGEPVPLYAYGPGAERFGGVIDNTDIPRRIAEFWGGELPRVIPK
jgi:Alkaline phosphatase